MAVFIIGGIAIGASLSNAFFHDGSVNSNDRKLTVDPVSAAAVGSFLLANKGKIITAGKFGYKHKGVITKHVHNPFHHHHDDKKDGGTADESKGVKGSKDAHPTPSSNQAVKKQEPTTAKDNHPQPHITHTAHQNVDKTQHPKPDNHRKVSSESHHNKKNSKPKHKKHGHKNGCARYKLNQLLMALLAVIIFHFLC